MARKILFFASSLAITGLVLYFTLPGSSDVAKKGKGKEEYFCRTVKLVSPPYYTVRKGTSGRISRLLDRIKWAPPRSYRRTVDLLMSDPDRLFLDEVIHRINLSRSSEQQVIAKKYIDLLAELNEPDALPVLIECSKDSSSMVHNAALKSLSRYEGQDVIDCLIEHASSTDPSVRTIALRQLSSRCDPKVTRYFEAALENEDMAAVPFAMSNLEEHTGDEFIPLIRKFLVNGKFQTRTLALNIMLKAGDESALKMLNAQLKHPGAVIRKSAVQSISYTGRLPDREALASVARDQDGQIRAMLSAVLASVADRHDGEQQAVVREILGILSEDVNPEIRLKANEGLYRSGMTSIAGRYIARLNTAYGGELREAITFLTVSIRKKDIGNLLINRFRDDNELLPEDRLAILMGLSAIACSDAAELFFEVIKGEWDSRETKINPFTLDRHAAFQVHNLGESKVMILWIEALESCGSYDMAYLFINGARNLEDERAADKLFELASDQERPEWLREEALLCFPWLKNIEIGDRLLEYAGQEINPGLSKLAVKIYWNYF